MTKKPPSPSPPTRTCKECGKPFLSPNSSRQYCCYACRLSFTRRRRDRGAELYDFVMQGDNATVAKLCAAYHQADLALRNGRQSYQPAHEAARNLPITYGKQGDKR